ncbi:hypothetical protein F5Y10DRAFT_292863 [Nemania abortiva]|nr:hypothetical protein F5Y10DRAFT_292863 [Nemania abortiva]
MSPRHCYHTALEDYTIPLYYIVPGEYIPDEYFLDEDLSGEDIPENYRPSPQDGPRGVKRKRPSQWDKVDLTPQKDRIYGTVNPDDLVRDWLSRQPPVLSMDNPGYETFTDAPDAVPGSEAGGHTRHDTAQPSQTSTPTGQESLDHSMSDIASSDTMPHRLSPHSGQPVYQPSHFPSMPAPSSLGVPFDHISFNSVRPPDPFIISDTIPWDLTVLQPLLFKPRGPPNLPPHILALPFRSVLNRYNRLTKMVDDYQKWHGRGVFAFWEPHEIADAESGRDPELTKALYEDRPSIPPHIINLPFDLALLCAPLLSRLIERYHNDIGFDYFGFYEFDPRDHLSDIDNESEISVDEDRLGGLRRICEAMYPNEFKPENMVDSLRVVYPEECPNIMNILRQSGPVPPRRESIGRRGPYHPRGGRIQA